MDRIKKKASSLDHPKTWFSIHQYLSFLELETPLPDYMEKVQNELSPIMREHMVNLLVEVADRCQLLRGTLHLCISYIDRFLSSRAVPRNKLMILGLCCMLIASKYEETLVPCVQFICYEAYCGVSEEHVLDMEMEVLSVLNFKLGLPTTVSFLRIFTTAAIEEDGDALLLPFVYLCDYLGDLSLTDYSCLRFLPSMIAASAVFLARFIMWTSWHPWSLAMQLYSGYKAPELKECVLALHDLQREKIGLPNCRAIRDIYNTSYYDQVSEYISPPEIPAHYFEEIPE